jgi:hypothetical protein
MAILGNLFLLIASAITLMLNVGALAKAPPRNDGAVGYGENSLQRPGLAIKS